MESPVELEKKFVRGRKVTNDRHETFKIGQDAYFLALDCGEYKVLPCSIVDMGVHESHIKLDNITRRSVVDSTDVFHSADDAIKAVRQRAKKGLNG